MKIVWSIGGRLLTGETEVLGEKSKQNQQLTPWIRVLPEKLTVPQLVKFPAFYGTRRFIIAFTSAFHLSLS